MSGALNMLASAGGGRYLTSGSDYDSTNDYATRGGVLTGIADGKQGIVSAWIRLDGGDGVVQNVLRDSSTVGGSGSTGHFNVLRGTGNDFTFLCENTGGSNILSIRTNTGAYVAGGSWRHLLASWDLATAGARHIYMNDVSDLLVTTFTNTNIDYTTGDFAVGAQPNGGSKLNGCLSELFFHTTYLDLSVEANRRKFISATGKPVSLGANGSTPLGVQPLLYAPNGDPSSNAGSGGAFTIVGALTAASTSPSD